MEAFPLRAVAHGERLTLPEHLGELRVRLLLSVAVLTVLFAGCLWQSRSLLHILNVPLAQLTTSSAAVQQLVTAQGIGGAQFTVAGGSTAASFAKITLRHPVRVAFHAASMLP